MAANCTIPSNPDVSGVGVRAAIYAQNLTCFLPVIVHLWDRKISRDELKGIKDQSIGMLAVAFAILLTTIILAKGAGGDQTITSYHAAVVLDLSWMNNTSTWIWFILYVHYRSKTDEGSIGANWSDWRGALLEPLWELLGQNERASSSTEATRITERIWAIAERIWRMVQRIWGFISEQPVLTLGSIHLSLMAAIGIWLWSDPSKFGLPLDTGCDPTLTVVGVPTRFSSKPLHIASLAMYSLVLIPGLNLIPPFAFFLTLHISYNWSRGRHLSLWRCLDHALDSMRKVFATAVSSGVAQHETSDSSANTVPPIVNPAVSGTVTLPGMAPHTEQGGSSQRSSAAVSSGVAQPETSDFSSNTAFPVVKPVVAEAATRPRTPHTAFLIVGLVLLVAINILFIVDIELTLRRNKGDQNGDNKWGFGQVLALLLLIIPLRDAWGALQDIREKLKGVQEQFEGLLRRECQATPVVEELGRLIRKGADPKARVRLAGTTFDNSSQLVTSYGKTELVQFLREWVNEGDEHVPDFSKVLQSALAGGHVLAGKALHRSQEFMQHLNKVEGEYGTALCAACASGKLELVNALLDAGAKRNVSGIHFGAPLHVAVLMADREMVEFLISDNPNNADCTWERFGTAVDVAGYIQNKPLFDLLHRRGLRGNYFREYTYEYPEGTEFITEGGGIYIEERGRGILEKQVTLRGYVKRDGFRG